jgi:predicted nucleotidyltransferase
MKQISNLRNLIISVFTVLSINVNAQIQFEQMPAPPPAPQIIADFDWIRNGSVAFADIDGDNDQDVLITGFNITGQIISKLYRNDSCGNYTLVSGTAFEGVQYSSVAFADIDGDGDQDVLITGRNNLSQNISKLYTNDGIGGFTLVNGTPFDGVQYSSVAFADIDGDNDLDVLIIGRNNTAQETSKLYTNDGSGNFTLVSGTPFDDVSRGSVSFSDIDGDNDLDVFITGATFQGGAISKLYFNDGNGNFTLDSSACFEGVYNSSVAFADIDGDNDEDLLIAGRNNLSQETTKLYRNDGNGNYSLVSVTSLDSVAYGSVAFADIDGDNDQDIFITGSTSLGNISSLYRNDGSGNYSLISATPFIKVDGSSIAFADIDEDNDLDVLITGINNSNQNTSFLYVNDGSGNYRIVRNTPFSGVFNSSIAFADIDGDNDLDVLITGTDSINKPQSRLYVNDSTGNYTLISGTPFDNVDYSSVAFADIDGDSDLDVLITGNIIPGFYVSKLYLNDGSGNYSLISGTPFEEVWHSSVAFADIDGDNDIDVLITGSLFSSCISKLYTNDGSGNFSLVSGTPFDWVCGGSGTFADIDGDSDLDVIIIGSAIQGNIANLYRNDGFGNFNIISGTNLGGVAQGSVAFADIDNDNDQDLLITGLDNLNQATSKLFINDGNGNFSILDSTSLDGVYSSSISFADIDSDNDQDVLITGLDSLNNKSTKLYTNDGNGNFTHVIGTPFDNVAYGSVAFADIDGDNDPDVLITGWNDLNQQISKIYRNNTCISYSVDVQNVCDSLAWINGNTYYTSNYTATDTLTSVNGCDSIITLNLTIGNSSVIDTITACDSLPWIDGNTYYTSNNTATHTLTNVSGCDSVITLSLTIDTINVSVTQIGATLTANDTGANYQWVFCPSLLPISGETNQSFSPIINGLYAVIISKGACVKTSSCYNINNIGIEETEKTLLIYPNPTTGKITIQCENMEKIELLDITGRIVYKQVVSNNMFDVDISTFNKGVYFIKVTADDAIGVERVVLE